MMPPNIVQGYVKAQPFRPFRIHMASGRTYDVRHPEMIKVLRSNILVFKANGEMEEIPEDFESVSLMLTESVSHLETPVQ